MNFKLVVIRAFESYSPGMVIDAVADIQKVLAGEHAMCVVRVAIAQLNAAGAGE